MISPLSKHSKTIKILHISNVMTSTYLWRNVLAKSSISGRVGSLHNFSSLIDVRLYVALLLPNSDVDTPIQYDEPLRAVLPPTIIKLVIDLDPKWDTIRFLQATDYPSNWETERSYFPLMKSFMVHRFVKAEGKDFLGVDDTGLSELLRVGIVIYPPPHTQQKVLGSL